MRMTKVHTLRQVGCFLVDVDSLVQAVAPVIDASLDLLTSTLPASIVAACDRAKTWLDHSCSELRAVPEDLPNSIAWLEHLSSASEGGRERQGLVQLVEHVRTLSQVQRRLVCHALASQNALLPAYKRDPPLQLLTKHGVTLPPTTRAAVENMNRNFEEFEVAVEAGHKHRHAQVCIHSFITGVHASLPASNASAPS